MKTLSKRYTPRIVSTPKGGVSFQRTIPRKSCQAAMPAQRRLNVALYNNVTVPAWHSTRMAQYPRRYRTRVGTELVRMSELISSSYHQRGSRALPLEFVTRSANRAISRTFRFEAEDAVNLGVVDGAWHAVSGWLSASQ